MVSLYFTKIPSIIIYIIGVWNEMRGRLRRKFRKTYFSSFISKQVGSYAVRTGSDKYSATFSHGIISKWNERFCWYQIRILFYISVTYSPRNRCLTSSNIKLQFIETFSAFEYAWYSNHRGMALWVFLPLHCRTLLRSHQFGLWLSNKC